MYNDRCSTGNPGSRQQLIILEKYFTLDTVLFHTICFHQNY